MSKSSSLPPPVRWTLKKGSDRRVREGHPWVFSNEISVSPKGLPAGAPIEIVDHRGEYLGFGYGNPHSLIAARLFSSRVGEKGDLSQEFLLRRVLFCWKRRLQLGITLSARLVFGEADEFPGLVLDRYLCRSKPELTEPDCQIFAAQFTTAGADRVLTPALGFFEELVKQAQSEGHTALGWQNTAVILRNDIKVRELEGLKVEAPLVVKDIEGFAWSQAEIAVSDFRGQPLWMTCDLKEGQKTGFFLDQTSNIHRVIQFVQQTSIFKSDSLQTVDLCCYVGHWSSQFSRAFSGTRKLQTHLADVSAEALERAASNSKKNGHKDQVQAQLHKMDVFDSEFPWAPGSMDIVVCDPPALIKSRKAMEQGQHGYMKINSLAAKIVKPGGLLVTCSCSGVLSDEDFSESIRKAFRRAGKKAVLLFKGGHGLDHPQRPEFPEGTYLKVHVYQLY